MSVVMERRVRRARMIRESGEGEKRGQGWIDGGVDCGREEGAGVDG